MNRSFRVRLTLVFGALVLGIVAALSLRLGALLSTQQLRERGEALHELAEGTGRLLAEGLYERMREVELLAQSADLGRIGSTPAERQATIARLHQGRPHYAWIGITDTGGRVLQASSGMLVGQDVSQRPWFRGAMDGPFVGDVHPAKLLAALLPAAADGEPLRFIDFAAPLRNAEGRFAGVVGLHIDWRWAQAVITQLRSDDERDAGMLVYIVGRDGSVIHHPGGPWAGGSLAAGSVASGAPAVLRWNDGLDYLTTAFPLQPRSAVTDLGWTVIVRQPAELALAGVAQVQRAVWLAGIGAAALAMLLAWIAAGHFSRPLARISQAAERIEGGRYDMPIPVSTRSSELERLSRSLANMTQRLLAREQALTDANQQLEARVAERTAALAEANTRLEALAHHDALTGLHNRRAADRLLDAELAHHRRHGRPLGVLMVDIDHFKRINDSHGHAVGDGVIRAVAQCFGTALRASDIAARFGGEEFLVLLRETDANGVARAGEKLRGAVAALQLPPVAAVTVSAGGAVARPGETAADLLARADAALYEAKHGGRNRVLLAA